MSDHLIAEANRHAMALPTTQPTHADIAWYVREVGELAAQLATERQKVRALTAILESICEEWGRNHDANPIGAGQKMETMASKALEKLEYAT